MGGKKIARMKFTAFLVAITLILCSGCQYDPYTSLMTINKPGVKDVVGIYHLKTQTITEKLKDEKLKKATLVLNADSTFTMTEVPDFTGTIDFKYQGVISAKGKWHIQIVGGIANGTGKPDTEWGMSLTSVPTNLQIIGFTGNKLPDGLLVTYGDPDTGAVMIFQKQE